MSYNSLILKNSLFLMTRTLIAAFVSLFTIRELLRVLGAQEYGLFNLIFGVAILFTFINQAMVVSSQRYLSFYLGKEDDQQLVMVWNSSFFLHVIIAVILSLVLVILKDTLLFSLLNIDKKLLSSAVFIYFGAIATIFITVIQSPFNALVLAKEDMSFYAWTSLVKAFLSLIIVYSLGFTSTEKLNAYTVLYVFTTLAIFVIYVVFCYRRYRLPINSRFLKKDLTKEIFFYSSWNIYGDFANVARTQGINVVLNLFFGLAINAAYAVTNNVVSTIGGLLNSVVTAIRPQIYKSYATKDTARNKELLSYGSKYNYLFSLFLISPFLINIEFVINLWLTEIPAYTIDFIKLALITTIINSLSGVLMAGIQATGKIKGYQLVVGFVVFLNLPASFILLKIYHNPILPFIIAIISAIISLYLRLIFLRNLVRYSLYEFHIKVIKPVLLVTIVAVPLYLLIDRYIYTSNIYIDFFIKCSVASILNIVLIYLIGLEINEREKLLNIILRIKK